MKFREQYNNSFTLWVMLLAVVAVISSEPIFNWVEKADWMKMVYLNLHPSLLNDIFALLILLLTCLIIDNYISIKAERVNRLWVVISFPLCILMLYLRIRHGSNYIPFFLLNDIKMDTPENRTGLAEELWRLYQKSDNLLKL